VTIDILLPNYFLFSNISLVYLNEKNQLVSCSIRTTQFLLKMIVPW